MTRTLRRLSFPLRATLLIAFLLYACGESRSGTQRTLVSTGQNAAGPSETTVAERGTNGADGAPEGDSAMPSDLRAQLIKDGRAAAEVLLSFSCENNSEAGIWATVYALRVGLRPKQTCLEAALIRGAHETPLLLRTLSWRHLVSEKNIALPDNVDFASADPTLRVLAALAYRTRSLPLPGDLAAALYVPQDAPSCAAESEAARERTAHLAVMARPFDDGLLAGATAFAEAQFEKSAIKSDTGPVWLARRIRDGLLQALDVTMTSDEETTDEAPPRAEPTAVGDLLENRLSSHPQEMLCNIALNAQPALRIEALRALVVRTESAPPMCAFAASAAAFRSSDQTLKIEGARTFLALIHNIGR